MTAPGELAYYVRGETDVLDEDDPLTVHHVRYRIVNNARHLAGQSSQIVCNFAAHASFHRTSAEGGTVNDTRSASCTAGEWTFVETFPPFVLRRKPNGDPMDIAYYCAGYVSANSTVFRVSLVPAFSYHNDPAAGAYESQTSTSSTSVGWLSASTNLLTPTEDDMEEALVTIGTTDIDGGTPVDVQAHIFRLDVWAQASGGANTSYLTNLFAREYHG